VTALAPRMLDSSAFEQMNLNTVVSHTTGFEDAALGMIEADQNDPCFSRFMYDGAISGRQDRMPLSAGAYALMTDFDHIPKMRLSQAGDNLLMIQFRLEGSMIFQADGRSRTFDRPVCLISHFPSGLSREIDYQGGAWRGVGLICGAEALVRWGLIDALPDALREQMASETPGFYLASIPMTHDMLESARGMLNCKYGGELRRAYTEAKCVETICGVLDRLQHLSDDDNENARFSPADLRRVRSAHEILESELAQPHTLASVSRRVGLNRSKLAAAFKGLYGTTFFDRMRDLRMTEACRLLEEDETAIAAVAQAVGYEDPCSFTRAFKGRFGVAPRMARSRPRIGA
jgi:AraC family transcriptional activator of pyochelin receptor